MGCGGALSNGRSRPAKVAPRRSGSTPLSRRAALRPVQLGMVAERFVEVESGLGLGERVVVGALDLRDGQAIVPSPTLSASP